MAESVAESGREGGCACGQVRYRVEAEPLFVNQCHCTLCQRQSGSAFAVNLFVESGHLRLLAGEVVEITVPTGSGAEQAIIRCKTCGTALWSHYGRLGRGGAAVRVGTLDDPGAVRPDAAIHVATRLPWVPLPEGVPAFETHYKPSDLLPQDRYRRLMTIIEGNAQA